MSTAERIALQSKSRTRHSISQHHWILTTAFLPATTPDLFMSPCERENVEPDTGTFVDGLNYVYARLRIKTIYAAIENIVCRK
jgi:hypothetical protein